MGTLDILSRLLSNLVQNSFHPKDTGHLKNRY